MKTITIDVKDIPKLENLPNFHSWITDEMNYMEDKSSEDVDDGFIEITQEWDQIYSFLDMLNQQTETVI